MPVASAGRRGCAGRGNRQAVRSWAQGGEDVQRAARYQALGQAVCQGGCFAARRTAAFFEDAAAVRQADAGVQVNCVVCQAGKGGERYLAAAFQSLVEDAFGLYAQGGVGIVEGGKQGIDGAVGTAFDADGALADGRQGNMGGQCFADACAECQTFQSGAGEDDGVEFAAVEFVETGLHVAAQIEQLQVGADGGKLHAAAQAACADFCALRQFGKLCVMVGDKGIKGVGAREDGGKDEAVREMYADIFHGMHGNIGAVFLHGDFQLFDEQPFAADAGKGRVQYLVAARGHRYEGDGNVRIEGAQACGNVFGLPQGKAAFAGGDADLARRVHLAGLVRMRQNLTVFIIIGQAA